MARRFRRVLAGLQISADSGCQVRVAVVNAKRPDAVRPPAQNNHYGGASAADRGSAGECIVGDPVCVVHHWRLSQTTRPDDATLVFLTAGDLQNNHLDEVVEGLEVVAIACVERKAGSKRSCRDA